MGKRERQPSKAWRREAKGDARRGGVDTGRLVIGVIRGERVSMGLGVVVREGGREEEREVNRWK